jgi:DNA-directed RNA polymerase specialized sigma24 family protein
MNKEYEDARLLEAGDIDTTNRYYNLLYKYKPSAEDYFTVSILKAINSYKGKGTLLNYIKIILSGAIKDNIRSENRKKRIPPNLVVSLDEDIDTPKIDRGHRNGPRINYEE